MTLQQTKDFLEWDNKYGLDFDDKVLSKNEVNYLQQRLLQCDKNKTAKDMIAAVNSLWKPTYEQKLSQFKTTPWNLWDKYNACSLTNEDVAMFQFLHNLTNPTKRITIDGLLWEKTYTAMFGYEAWKKYDIQITKNNLRKAFPENGSVKLTNEFINAWVKAISQKENPFLYQWKSYMRRYDSLISITSNKEKYTKTQDAKNLKEYQNIVWWKVNQKNISQWFDTGKQYLRDNGNIVWLEYDFKSPKLAEQCNIMITKKFNNLLKICKDKKISLASESPFSKIYTWSGHFQFDGIYQNGETYEVDPVFSAEDMGWSDSSLYKIIDENEDQFLQHLNNRWNTLYNKYVVEIQKNDFIPWLDINWWKNTEKVKKYLNLILQKSEEHNKKYPANEAEPFKNDDSFDDQEIYFTWLETVTRYEAKTWTPYTSLEKKELWCFSKKSMQQLWVENIMNDDNNVKKVVKWLNNAWMEKHVLKQVVTKENAALLISKDALKKKLQDDVDLTPKELQALQYYENQDFTKVMNDSYFGTKEAYLSLYTRDEWLVKGLGEKTLDHINKVADKIVAMNPEYAITVLQKLHAQYDDERHPDSAMAILKQFTEHFWQKIYDSLSKKMTQDPKNKEKYQKSLLSLAKLVTDRNWNIDTDLKDIWLAKKIMNDLMPAVIDKSQNNQEWDDQCEKRFNSNKAKVVEIFWTNPQLKALVGNGNSLSWNSLKSFEQKQYVNTLVEYVIRFGDPKKDSSLQGLSPQEQVKKITARNSDLVQISMKWLMTSFTDFADAWGKYSDDLQLTWFQKEIYDMYRDMMWIGKFNLSDDNFDTTVEYWKMAAVIVVAIAATIAVTVATWGTWTGAAVALSRSAIWSMAAWAAASAAAGSLAWYLADYLINKRQAESNDVFMKDMFSTFAVDVATSWPFALVPWLWPLLAKYPKLANIFVKIWNTICNKAVTWVEMVTSAAVSWYAEQWRQKYIMWSEQVTFDQLVQQIGMWLALPAIFQWWPKMLSYLRIKWDIGKVQSWLEQSITYVDEILKKKLPLEEKKFFTNLKQQYINNANQLEKMLSPGNFAKQKEWDKVVIVWWAKKHALQKSADWSYTFVSNNWWFVQWEKVSVKEKDGKLMITRNSGKELWVQDWSLVEKKMWAKNNNKISDIKEVVENPIVLHNDNIDTPDTSEIVLDLDVNGLDIAKNGGLFSVWETLEIPSADGKMIAAKIVHIDGDEIKVEFEVAGMKVESAYTKSQLESYQKNLISKELWISDIKMDWIPHDDIKSIIYNAEKLVDDYEWFDNQRVSVLEQLEDIKKQKNFISLNQVPDQTKNLNVLAQQLSDAKNTQWGRIGVLEPTGLYLDAQMQYQEVKYTVADIEKKLQTVKDLQQKHEDYIKKREELSSLEKRLSQEIEMLDSQKDDIKNKLKALPWWSDIPSGKMIGDKVMWKSQREKLTDYKNQMHEKLSSSQYKLNNSKSVDNLLIQNLIDRPKPWTERVNPILEKILQDNDLKNNKNIQDFLADLEKMDYSDIGYFGNEVFSQAWLNNDGLLFLIKAWVSVKNIELLLKNNNKKSLIDFINQWEIEYKRILKISQWSDLIYNIENFTAKYKSILKDILIPPQLQDSFKTMLRNFVLYSLKLWVWVDNVVVLKTMKILDDVCFQNIYDVLYNRKDIREFLKNINHVGLVFKDTKIFWDTVFNLNILDTMPDIAYIKNMQDLVSILSQKKGDASIESNKSLWDMSNQDYYDYFEMRKGQYENYTTLSIADYDNLFFDMRWLDFETTIKQANVGNCYLIAALHALRKSPHFEALIRTSIKILPDWNYEVRLPLWDVHWKWIHVLHSDITNSSNKKDPVKASQWYKILEAAYTLHEFWRNVEWSIDRVASEWWLSHHSMTILLWKDRIDFLGWDKHGYWYNFDNVESINKFYNLLENYDNQRDVLFLSGYSSLTAYTAILRGNLHASNLYKDDSQHAFYIESVNKIDKMVTIINPWDTSKKMKCSWDDVIKNYIDIHGIHMDYAKMFDTFNQ